MSDLIERLRKSAGKIGLLLSDPPKVPEEAALMLDAADYITTLEAKLAVAREALEDAQSALRGSGEFDVIAKIGQALQEIEQ